MANLSEANGTVYIKASNLKIIEYFLYIQEESNKYTYYPTQIVGNNDSISELVSSQTIEVDDYFLFTSGFDAEGCWCFENNLNDFFDCTLYQDTDEELTRKMKKYVRKYDIQFQFEYVDAEASQNFIKEQKAIITYDSETAGLSIDIETIKEVPYTVENLIDYDFYEPDEIVSIQFLLDYYYDYCRGNDFYLKHKDEIIPILKKQQEKEEVYFFLESLESSIPELKEFVEKNKE